MAATLPQSEQQPQFPGGGPQVVVKNTFIDVADDVPPMQSLQRSKTWSAGRGTATEGPEQAPRSPGSSSTCSSADSDSGRSPFFPAARSPGTGSSSRSSSVSERWSSLPAGCQALELTEPPVLDRVVTSGSSEDTEPAVVHRLDDLEDEIEPPELQRVNTVDTWEDIQHPGLNRLTTLDRWEEQCDNRWVLDGTAAAAHAPEQIWYNGEAFSNAWAFNGAMTDQPMPAGAAPMAFLMPVPVANMLPIASVWTPAEPHESPPGEETAVPNAVAQPQGLTLTPSNEGTLLVRWTVDARKLRSNDKQAVSPSFDLSSFTNVPLASFKILMHPKPTIPGRHGGECFRKAGGRGMLQLKCESDLCDTRTDLTFWFSIGRGKARQGPCKPFTHNFAANAMAEVCREVTWNFDKVVEQASMTFEVELEISMNAA